MNLSQVTLIASDFDRSLVLYAINLPIVFVCALLVRNVLRAAASCPLFFMLVLSLAIGRFSFARQLLFPSSEETRV
jgi:hypothetical protein